MARRKKIGDVYRFHFDEKYHCYCQLATGNDVCFYDYYSSDFGNDDIEKILNLKGLFRILCYRDCFKGEKWIFICNKPLTEDKIEVPFKWHKAVGDDYYSLYRDGVFIKTTRENCIGLECFALWTELGVIDRLNYSFFGKELLLHLKQDLPFYE